MVHPTLAVEFDFDQGLIFKMIVDDVCVSMFMDIVR